MLPIWYGTFWTISRLGVLRRTSAFRSTSLTTLSRGPTRPIKRIRASARFCSTTTTPCLSRKQSGTALIPAYYEGTDRLSWAGTVLADMNGLHARPIIPAFVLACMQFREWHDLYFTASTSNIQFAFGANISILDLVSVGVYTELTLRSPLLPLPLRSVHSSPSTSWKRTR